MNRITSRKAGLSLGVSTVAVAAALLAAPGMASAQSAPAGDTAVEDVVVTGIRAALRSAADVKRNSVQVVDAISAEDIGDFPDKNLGEALQRVTGVQISRQDGEGRGVSIRGAEPGLNRVEVNGSTALSLSVGGGRDVDFRDLPVEFVSRLEVVKSQTADQTEGGIGGVVRVITRRPFDNGGREYLAGSVQGAYSNLAATWDPKVAVIGSRTFLDGNLGVLLGVQAEKRHLNSNNARTTGWIRRGAIAISATNPAPPAGFGTSSDINADGTLDWIPEIPRYIVDTRETSRLALNGIVEYRMGDDLSFFAEGTYARAKEDVRSQLLQLSATGGLIDYTKSTVGPDNTVNHIEIIGTSFRPLELAYRNINGDLEREQYTTAVGGRWTPGNWIVNARVNYSAADVQNNEKNATATITGPGTAGGAVGLERAVVDYTGSQRAPNITFPNLDVTTGARVNRLAAVFNPRTNTQEEIAGKLDLEYRPDNVGWLTSMKGGIEQRKLTMDSLLYSRTTQINPTAIAQSASTQTYIVSAPNIAAIVDNFATLNKEPFFKTGDLGFDSGTRFWNNNGDAVYDATVAAAGLPAGGNDPYATQNFPNNNNTYQNYLDTWSVKEETMSAYWQTSFEFETFLVPVSGTIGTRFVDTDTLSTGFNRVAVGTGAAQVITFPQGQRAGGYSKWLPSANLRFDLMEDKLIGRLTAGKVMARPNPSQLALRQSIDGVGLTATRGNPDLQPYEATNYDAGLEYYFNRDSFVSATLFRKNISSFIINQGSREALDVPGFATPQDVLVTRPVNGTDRVTINGIEVGVQYTLDFLPAPFDGVGVLANFTHQKDEGFKGTNLLTGEILPFPGLSRDSYNLSVFYENELVSARLSYNHRSQWLITPNGRGSLPEFNEAFGSLDASASYNVNEKITVFVEGINLTDEVRIENNNPFRRIGNETYGSRYFVGVRARF